MKNIKKQAYIIINVVSILWCVFVVLHVILTGKIYMWNFIASLPTFIFFVIPTLFLIYQLLQKKKRWILVSIQVLALVLGITQVDFNLVKLDQSSEINDTYREVKVLNWNTECWDQEKDREQFFRFLKNQKADIYILQEYLHGPIDLDSVDVDEPDLFSLCPVMAEFPKHYKRIDDMDRLKQEFPQYSIISDEQFVVLSRYPIKSYFCDSSGQFLVSDIDIYGKTVRFYNVHMLLHLNPEEPLNAKELDKRYRARDIGFQNLKYQTEKCDVDYFISGDFNSTTAMGVMDDLLKKNCDIAKYSRDIMPFTFNFKGIKLWRFDYAFISKESKNIKVKSYKAIDPEGLSDHDALFVDLCINTK